MYYIRHDDDWDCDKSLYYKILNDFDHIEKSDWNNIANLINNDNYIHDITLLVDDSKRFICEKNRYFDQIHGNGVLEILFITEL